MTRLKCLHAAPILLPQLRIRGAVWLRSVPPPLQVLLQCPYITLTWVHSLKRPGETLSLPDDIFAIPLSEVCEHLIAVQNVLAQVVHQTKGPIRFKRHISQVIQRLHVS